MKTLDKITEWLGEDSTRGASALLVFYVLFLFGAWVVAEKFLQTMGNRLTLINILNSSILSLVLIAVYMEMSESQWEQTEQTIRQADLQKEVVNLQERQLDQQEQVLQLQENQTKLMGVHHRTVVEIEDYRAEDEKLILEVSNFGNGVATDLELVVLTGFEGSENLEPDITSTALTRRSEDPDQYRRGSSIKAGEDNISFEARPGMVLRYDADGVQQSIGYQFGAGMDRLTEAGVNLIVVYFYVRYRDLLGEYHLDPVFTLEATPERGYNNFEEVYREAGYHPAGFGLVGQPQISPDDLSFDLPGVSIPNDRTVV